MPRNQRWINKQKGVTPRNFDAGKLDYLQKGLQQYSLGSIREKTIIDPLFSPRNHVRNPDLIIGKRIIMEHDTVKLHGELGYENERTLRRNGDFTITGRPFTVINADLAKQLGLDEGNLAVYLYFHECMKINALQEAESRVG